MNTPRASRLFPALLLLGVLACGDKESSGCGKGERLVEPPPNPADIQRLRTDLMYGYYGDCANCQSETQAHVNMFWLWGWDGDWRTNIVNRIRDAKRWNVPYIIVGLPQSYEPNAEELLRDAFEHFKEQGVLADIDAFYPIDEPDVNGKPHAQVVQVNQTVRRVAAEFPELRNVKLAVIYGAGNNRPGLATYDWVGFDDYGKGDRIFMNGDYTRFKNSLRADQRIMLVPGGADPWKQDVGPFFTKAQLDPQVIGLVPFIWRDHADTGVGQGIRTNTRRCDYIKAGKQIKNPADKNPSC